MACEAGGRDLEALHVDGGLVELGLDEAVVDDVSNAVDRDR